MHKRMSEPQNANDRDSNFFSWCTRKDKTLKCYSMWTRSHPIAHYKPEKEKSSQRYETTSLASIQRAHRQKQKGTTKCRLNRTSFLRDARRLERQDPKLLQHVNKISSHCSWPAWKREQLPKIRDSIPGIYPKGTSTETERKTMTIDFMEQAYPQQHWTHAYRDGSADEATKYGDGGIYISLNNKRTSQQVIQTVKFSTNCKAEADARQTAAKLLLEKKEATHPKLVIFWDALSVL